LSLRPKRPWAAIFIIIPKTRNVNDKFPVLPFLFKQMPGLNAALYTLLAYKIALETFFTAEYNIYHTIGDKKELL